MFISPIRRVIVLMGWQESLEQPLVSQSKDRFCRHKHLNMMWMLLSGPLLTELLLIALHLLSNTPEVPGS